MKNALLVLLILGLFQFVEARPPKNYKQHSHVTYRADCQPGTSQVDLSINNVRARLLSRGDLWWDYNNAVYEVPKGGGVSTIGAGAIWMGGYDALGNLKLAATTYAADGQTDYYPGPLEQYLGSTDATVCSQWDRKFVVYGSEIDMFRAAWKMAYDNGQPLYDYQIPDNIKAYPGRGNPFYTNGFDLPDQPLAPFYDRVVDGIYNPLDGDYPILLGGFGYDSPEYADEMIFQIFNDAGGVHANTSAGALQMETQLMSFAFNSEDFLKNVTFESYKLIYRGSEPIYDTYFSFWVDGDIGCSEDDFVGVDTTRDLVYFYNASNVDGNCGSSYGTEIPIQGVKLIRGPLGDGAELGLTSFIYYNNTNSSFPSSTTDPESATEYYHYMSGVWKDGTPIFGGKNGFHQQGYPIVKFAFPSPPNNPNGWSMAQEELAGRDLRGVLSSGPFKLQPGITNRFIISLSTVLNVKHPKPKIKALQELDSLIDHFLLNYGCFLPTSSVQDLDLVLFPNPTSDYIHIQSTQPISTVQLQLVNMSGQVVLSQKISLNDEISIRHLPQGVYGYQIKDAKGVILSVGQLSKD